MTPLGKEIDRRRFLIAAAMAFGSKALALQPEKLDICSSNRLSTPYKIDKLVLSASSTAGAYDSVSVDSPFTFSHRGSYYMTFVGFDGVGYQTGLARSSDLVNWKKEGLIFRRDPSSPILKYNAALSWILRENELYSDGALKKVNGEFIGAYHAYPEQGLEQGAAVIGLARSKNLYHWEVGPPILRPEDGAAWERGGLYKPCLVEYKGKYYLFYNAKNQTTGHWHEQTGMAVSEDLKHWTRFSGNPIIRNGGPGAPDEEFSSDPCVLRNHNEWAFFYFGLDSKGVARDLVAVGPDLSHPTKCPRILIDVGPPGSIDSVFAHKPSLIADKGDLYHFYCAVSRVGGKERRGISVARSIPWKGSHTL